MSRHTPAPQLRTLLSNPSPVWKVATGLLLCGFVSPAWAQTPGKLPHQVTPWTPIPARSPSAAASVVAPAVTLNSTTWTSIGPAPLTVPGSSPVSGRIAGIAAHPTDPNTIYIAAAGGGVWKTSNGGTTWTNLTGGQKTLSMGALAIAPSNPSILYAGTGEANNSADSNFGRGILISTDAGATWTLSTGPSNAFDRLTTSQIAIDPTNPNRAFVAMSGFGNNTSCCFPNAAPGIWATQDGGASWFNRTQSISTSSPWTAVVVDPSNPQIVYAAQGLYFGSSTNGVYKSTDGGFTFNLIYNGTSNGTGAGRIALALSPSNSQVLYVIISGSGQSGSTFGALYKVLRSDNGGGTFTDLTAGTPNFMGDQGWYDLYVIVNPASSAIVYVAGSAGSNSILRSADSGAHWTDISFGGMSPHVDHHASAFDANGRLLDGDDGGIYRLDNPTSPSWTDLNGNLATIQFQGIGLHPTDPNKAIGGSQDNGTEIFNGSTWTETDGGDGGFAKFSSTNGNRAYHEIPVESFGSNFFRRSDDGGNTWVTKTNGLANDSINQNFYAPFVVDPGNGNRVLFGTNNIWETLDGGDTWTQLSKWGTNGYNPNGTPVDAIGLAPSDPNTIYVSTDDQVFVTTNHGATWTGHTVSGSRRINDIQVDPSNAQLSYAVINPFSSEGHIFRTADGGITWTNISGNLPDIPMWSLQIDPAGVLYVGADDGVYSTTNGGAFWGRFASGLPNAQVFQLELNNTLHILGAATHGRGMWEISTVCTSDCSSGTATPFITGQTPGAVRNSFSGFAGLAFTVGSTPLSVSSLGRMYLSGNSGTHTIKLVQASNGLDVPGGSVSLSLAGGTPNTYKYAALANPVTLQANTRYFLLSLETAGGDTWYDYGPVTSTSVGVVNGPEYQDAGGTYNLLNAPGQAYVPVSFTYGSATSTLSIAIMSPVNGAMIGGSNVQVTVSTTGSVTSVQLQVDGNNVGNPSTTPPFNLTLDTTTLTNGPHTLVAVASDGQGHSVPSSSVSVTVSNSSSGNSTSFISGGTPGAVRNNFGGFVGIAFTIGPKPLTVNALGRIYLSGNSGTHTIKLVQSNGGDVPGGSASLSLAGGGTPNAYLYAPLASPVTLQANTKYFLFSFETSGGDTWYDYGPVTASNVAVINGPAYRDTNGNFNTLDIPGQAWVPVNFTYGGSSSTLSVNITSPANGAPISGNNVQVTVSTTGLVTSVQLQVDGNNVGSPSTAYPFTLALNTTTLSNGPHTLVAVASDGQGHSAPSSSVGVTVDNSSAGTSTPFVTSQTPGAVRNNFSGFAGMAFTVGAAPLSVSSLGRIYLSGNSGTHTVKLVQSNGVDVPGGSVSLILAGGGATNTYKYAALASPVTLQANTQYFLVSVETIGGDTWYDYGSVTSTNVGVVNAPVYQDGGGIYNTLSAPGQAYVPVNFLYGGVSSNLSVNITSPANGAPISGNNVQVTVSTTGPVTSVQLQVDGNNAGDPSVTSPFTLNLDTTSLSNGPHNLVAVASNGQGNSAPSAPVNVTVNNNSSGTATPFLTSQTPGAVRADFNGFVGMAFTVGSAPLSVTSLGRIYLSGNSKTHTIKLVASNGTDIPGGSVSLSLAGGGSPNTYLYAPLASPVTLQANTRYFVVSFETAGGDSWYDYGRVTSTSVALVNAPAYQDGNGTYNMLSAPGQAYVPVNFTYQ